MTGGYIGVKVRGPLGQIETTGFTDPGITFHANIFGAPALRRDQFAQAIPQFQGNNKLSQNPLGIFSAFYSHNIGKRWYAGISATYDNGGDTYINGISQHTAANGFRPGIYISRARTIWKYRLTLKYELTGTTPTASPTNSVLSLRTGIPLF